MPVHGKPNGRFELPQFTPLNFSQTFSGTDIPPPPDSPIDEKPPLRAAEVAENPPQAAAAVATNGETNGHGLYNGRVHSTEGVHASVTTDLKPPMSPTSSHTRPSSIRRFLSRKSLNTNYQNGTNTNASHEDLTSIGRPDSAMSFASTNRPGKQQRSSSWFRRMSSNLGGSRTSVIYEEKRQNLVPMGPPPPKLPELSKLGAKIPEDDEGSLGGEELFKNIK